MIKYWCAICNRYHDGTSSAACGALTLIPPTNTVNSGLYSEDIKAEAIAARDKWWVVRIEREFGEELQAAMECTDRYCKSHLGKENNCISCIFYVWQQLKKDMGVKE